MVDEAVRAATADVFSQTQKTRSIIKVADMTVVMLWKPENTTAVITGWLQGSG